MEKRKKSRVEVAEPAQNLEDLLFDSFSYTFSIPPTQTAAGYFVHASIGRQEGERENLAGLHKKQVPRRFLFGWCSSIKIGPICK